MISNLLSKQKLKKKPTTEELVERGFAPKNITSHTHIDPLGYLKKS